VLYGAGDALLAGHTNSSLKVLGLTIAAKRAVTSVAHTLAVTPALDVAGSYRIPFWRRSGDDGQAARPCRVVPSERRIDIVGARPIRHEFGHMGEGCPVDRSG
jgi:hypothetical protein